MNGNYIYDFVWKQRYHTKRLQAARTYRHVLLNALCLNTFLHHVVKIFRQSINPYVLKLEISETSNLWKTNQTKFLETAGTCSRGFEMQSGLVKPCPECCHFQIPSHIYISTCYTVCCHYNTVIILQNPHDRQPIGHPWYKWPHYSGTWLHIVVSFSSWKLARFFRCNSSWELWGNKTSVCHAPWLFSINCHHLLGTSHPLCNYSLCKVWGMARESEGLGKEERYT